MYPVIPVELTSSAVQVAVLFVTIVAALVSFLFTARA
jgi:hypothetical protein